MSIYASYKHIDTWIGMSYVGQVKKEFSIGEKFF